MRVGTRNCCMGLGARRRSTLRAHLKHLLHVRDTGRVETQRLVERPRILPIQNGARIRQGVRCGSAVGTQNCCAGMRRAQEHTANISLMSVTLDVSRLSDWLNPLVYMNIARIFVTLDVSRLSGWLNASILCRFEMGRVRHGGRCGSGDPTVEVGARRRSILKTCRPFL